VLELYQTEWCLASRRVRQRLTELGIDYVIRQVPADPQRREALVAATGASSVPALVLEGGSALVGEDAIGAYLDDRYPVSLGSWAHRARAEKARRRYLEEECECSQAATR
jgi:glutathione S-transferase